MRRNEKIEVKLSPEEKHLLEEKAKSVGVTKSTLIRQLLQTDDRIIVLGSGQEIVSVLYQINAKLEGCLAMKTLAAPEAASLREAIRKIAAAFCTLADGLTDLSEDDDGEGSENVNPENGE